VLSLSSFLVGRFDRGGSIIVPLVKLLIAKKTKEQVNYHFFYPDKATASYCFF
jgi:hypothetical protein